MKKIVIFGQGMMFDVIAAHIERDNMFEIVGVTMDREWLPATSHVTISARSVPILPFNEVTKTFPPKDYGMFVAIGYHDMNQVRRQKCDAARQAGYELVSYISPRADIGPWVQIGDNCLVLDGAGIQPGASLGNNVWVWNSSLIGHHVRVEDDCWIAAGTTIGGAATIGSGCFFGLGATIGGSISVGEKCFFGARSLVTKSAGSGQVFIERDSELFRLDSQSFSRISKLHTIGPST